MNQDVSRSSERPRLRVFVSSPGDVAEERLIANRILDHLAAEFAPVAKIESIFWEHEPLLASDTFQAQIVRPAETDIVVCILWSRLGTRLPRKIVRADGSTYNSGTEFEFEDALEGRRQRGTPDLLVYRKMAEPLVSLKDVDTARQAVEQRAKLDDFVRRFFHGTDGTLVAAFHPFDNAADFETRLEDHLHKLVEVRLQQLGVTFEVREDSASPTWTAGCPFRGLNVFEYEHTAIFFGRTRAISDVLQQIKQQAAEGRAFLLVLGESGCGKSSLVRAGIMPLLMQPGVVEGVGLWKRAIVRPGERSGDLFDCLATALLREEALPELASDGTTAATLAKMLRAQPEVAPMLVKGALSQAASHLTKAETAAVAPGARLILFLDQLEELFTADDLSATERTGFFVALRALAESGQTWVVATLRSDFYHRASEIPALVELKSGLGQYDLKPPDHSEIAQLVRRPAFAAGLRFEEDLTSGNRLDDLLRDAAAANRECLPLLEFTLEELYRLRSGNVLTLQAYRDLGGIEGALARRASEEFAKLSTAGQAALPSVFRHLIAVSGDTGTTATRKQAPLATFDTTPGSSVSPARELIDAFIAARLLTGKHADDGAPLVEVTHEALLTRWQPLVDWLREDRELLQVRGRVSASAARWEQEGRRQELLLQPGKPLDEGLQLQNAGFALTTSESRFIEASRLDSVRRQRVRRTAISALAALTVLAIVGGLTANGMRRRAVESESQAVKARDEARENAQLARDQERKTLAASEEARRTLVNLLLFNGERLQNDGDLAGAALWFSKVLPLLATHDADAEQLHRIRLGLILRQLPRPTSMWLLPFEQRRRILRQAISPNGQQVLCTGASQSVFGVYAASGKPLWPPLEHDKLVTWAGFSADGNRIITLAQDRQMRVWDAETGKPLTPTIQAANEVPWSGSGADGRAELSADHRLLVVTTTPATGRTVEVWDITAGKPVFPPLKFPTTVAAAHFSGDGEQLLVGADATLQTYNLADGKISGEPINVPSLWDARYSPDGRWIATTSGEGYAQLWDATTRKPVSPLLAHRGPVTQAIFSPDSQRLLTLSADRTARLWNVSTGKALGLPLEHMDRPFSGAFSTDGKRMVTVGFDHTVRLWDGLNGQLLSSPWRHSWEPDAAAIDSGVLIVAEGRGINWDASRSAEAGSVRLQGAEEIQSLTFAGDGSFLVAAGGKQVWLLDPLTGASKVGPLVHVEPVKALGVAHDGPLVATGCEDGTVRVWRTADGQRLEPILKHKGPITQIKFDAPSKQLLTCSADHTARIWDVATGQPIGPPLEHQATVNDGDFGPDGQWVVTGGDDGTARLWNTADGTLRTEPQAIRKGEPIQAVTQLNVDSKGAAVLLAGNRGDLLVWAPFEKPDKSRPLQLGAAIRSASFSPDGRRVLAAGFSNLARVWDWQTADRPPTVLPTLTAALQGKFHPGSRIVALTSFKGVELWESESGRPLGARLGPLAKCLDFSPDGQWLVAADQQIRWWSMAADSHTPENLDLLIRLLAMREIDERGALQFLPSDRLSELFAELSKSLSEDFCGEPGRTATLGDKAP